MQATPAKPELSMAAGVSNAAIALRAAEQACDQAASALGPGVQADVVFVYFSAEHVEEAPAIAATIRDRLRPTHIIGMSTSCAVGGPLELEGLPGLSLLAARMPGASFTPFSAEGFPAFDGSDESVAKIGETIGVAEDLRFTLLLADPFSVPVIKLLPTLNRAKASAKDAKLFGGMASAAAKPGGNALILNDRVFRSGAVGLSIRGPFHVDTVISQGCRPFGPPLIITKARNNLIFELGGRPALEVIQEAVSELGDTARAALSGGLFIGRVINEYKSRFGRGDFLIRNVTAVDPDRGAIAVADFVRVGQTVRMHARDAVTAHEDLALLLDAQRLYDRPKGAMLITCNGRGKSLFGSMHHDAGAVVKAFTPPQAGESLAKPGMSIRPANDGHGPIPLAGCFASGEIGPVGEDSFVHGTTACVALFRQA